MRDAQLSATFIGPEYQKNASEMVDTQSDLSTKCGACDIVMVKDKQLVGDFIAIQSLFELLDEKGVKKVAVIGAGALAKAIALAPSDYELFFYHEYIESLMTMNETVEVDINRLSSGCDLSIYDAVIDASTIESLAMVSKLPSLCIDLKSTKQLSALRQRASELGSEYVGYEAQLARFTQNAYNYVKNIK